MIFGNPRYFGPQADQNSIFSAPQPATPPIDLTGAPAQPAAQPFVWGQGGARLTPEQIQLQQQSLLARQKGDYSPIASPWQGLARVADQAGAAVEQRQLDKKVAAQDAARQQSVAALLAPQNGSQAGGINPVAVALTSNDPVEQKLGMAMWERQNPKPVNNDSVADWNFYQGALTPDQFEQWKANRIYSPPHFAIIDGAPAMVGGYQPPAQSGPPDGAITMLRANPKLAGDFDAKYGVGAAQRILGGR